MINEIIIDRTKKILGLIALIFSFAQIISLYAGFEFIITLAKGMQPIRFNSALGFFLISLGFVSYLRNKNRISQILALASFAIAIATLTQIFFDLDFHIDELLYKDTSPYKGRMAANAAFSIALLSIALIFSAYKKRTFWPYVLKLSAALFVLLSAFSSVIGYISGISASYNWMNVGEIALPAIILKLILSSAMLMSPLHYFTCVSEGNVERTLGYNMRQKILLMFIIALFLLGVSFIGLIEKNFRYHIIHDYEDNNYYMNSFIDKQEELTKSVAKAIYEMVKENSSHSNHEDQLFQNNNRENLIKQYKDIYNTILTDTNISHFYFIKKNHEVLLRLHNPDKYGDILNRQTILIAEETGEISYGMEKGPLGFMTYRVVIPYHSNKGTLLGYIEIGKELPYMLNEASKFFGFNFSIYLYKKQFPKRTDPDYKNFFVYHKTSNIPSNPLQQYLKELDHEHKHGGEHKENSPQIEDQYFLADTANKHFMISHRHITDMEGNILGGIISEYDIADIVKERQESIFFCILVISLLSFTLIMIINYVLRYLENGIHNYQKEIKHQNQNLEKTVKKRTNELKETSDYLKSIFDSAVDGIITIDSDGIIQDINKKIEEMFIYPKEYLIGRNVTVLMPKRFSKDHDKYLKHYIKNKSSDVIGIRREIFGKRKNGREFPIEIALSEVKRNNKIIFIGLIKDITERRKAEELIRTNEEKFRKMFETSPLGMALCDIDGKLIDVNQAFADIIGCTPKKCLKLSYWDITPKRYEKQEAQQLESLNANGEYGPYEKHYKHKNGHEVPVLLRGVKFNNEKGKEQIWSFVEDITEKKHTEQTIQKTLQDLKAEKDFTQNVMDSIHNPIFVKDEKHNWIGGNKAFWKMLEVKAEDFLGKNDTDIFPQEQIDVFWEKDDLVIKTGETNINEEIINTPKGAITGLTTKSKISFPDGKKGLVGVILDITERKKWKMS